MSLERTIRSRRSIKRFTDEPVTRDDIERLLDSVCQAPNHRMTEPWRFYVLGPKARVGYGRALGLRKAKKFAEPGRAEQVVARVQARHHDLPAMLAVAIERDDNPEIHAEDHSAAYMGIQNLSLMAHEMGLGTHLKTGAVMDDPRAREAVGVPDSQRIVAIIEVGWPAETPPPIGRCSALELTTWTE